jgi:peroxiredoxin
VLIGSSFGTRQLSISNSWCSDLIACVAVNDVFVMSEWGEDLQRKNIKKKKKKKPQPKQEFRNIFNLPHLLKHVFSILFSVF